MPETATIKLGNVNSRIFGYLPDEVMDALYEKLSYKNPNSAYISKVIDGKWDGVTRLFNRYKKVFNTGLLSDVRKILKDYDFQVEIDDQRVRSQRMHNWQLILSGKIESLYDFQEEAVYQAKKAGRGAFAMPTASGKTLTFTDIIAEIGVSPVIIYVPSLLLLYQTKNEIEKYLRDKEGKPVDVGIVGDGQCDIKEITVMTIQTAITALDMEYNSEKDTITYLTPEQMQLKNKQLQQKTKKKKRSIDDDPDADEDLSFVVTRKDVLQGLIQNAKMIVADEAHRCSSVIYQEVLKQSVQAYYRMAFSGTMKRQDNSEILIQGTFGRKLINISPSELIRRGVIVRPYVFMVGNPESQNEEFSTFDQIRKNYVVQSETRNRLLASIAARVKEYGAVLMLVGIVVHGEALEKMIPGSMFIHSKTPEKKKKQALVDLMSGELPILIATSIADEGLNLPDLRVLMICDGGKAENRLYQRIGRVSRKFENKNFAIVIDIKDKNKKLAEHVQQREMIYLNEEEYIITHVGPERFRTVKGL